MNFDSAERCRLRRRSADRRELTSRWSDQAIFTIFTSSKGESQMKSKGLKSGLKLNTAVKIE